MYRLLRVRTSELFHSCLIQQFLQWRRDGMSVHRHVKRKVWSILVFNEKILIVTVLSSLSSEGLNSDTYSYLDIKKNIFENWMCSFICLSCYASFRFTVAPSQTVFIHITFRPSFCLLDVIILSRDNRENRHCTSVFWRFLCLTSSIICISFGVLYVLFGTYKKTKLIHI